MQHKLTRVKTTGKDFKLKAFLKAGGRNGAKKDFMKVLTKALASSQNIDKK